MAFLQPSWAAAAAVEEAEDDEKAAAAWASLLETSRTQEGRSHLAPLVPSLLRRLRPGDSLLLPSLRLLRNLCAGEPVAVAAFLDAAGPAAVASVVLRGGRAGAPPVPSDVVRVGLQVLANVAVAEERGRREIWERFFPEGLLELSRVGEVGCCDALCMLLRSCCWWGEGSRGRLEDLCGVGRGLPTLKEIVVTADAGGYRGDWLKLLLSRLCFEEPCFLPLFSMLSSRDLGAGEADAAECSGGASFTAEQAFLLSLLSEILSENLHGGRISGEFALAVSQVLRRASVAADFFTRGTSPLPTGSPDTDVLGYSLAILRDICALDDGCASSPASDGVVDSLVSSGLCSFLIALLRELEPPSTIRRSLATRSADGGPPPSTSGKVCPYKGFRRDVVAVIGNCSCGRKHVQDEVRRRDGVLLLLQQCAIDEDNAYLREWGMLAAGHLLKGNAENQRLVSELELQGSVDSPEIAELGLRVDVDGRSGRAKLVNARERTRSK